MTARPPRWRRTLRRMALALPLAALAAALAAAGYAWQWWLQVQQEQGIVGLDWHGLQVSRHGLRLERLELQQLAADGRRLQLAADTVQLDWRLQRTASYLERLHVAHLQLDWQAPAAPGGEASRLPSADALAGLLAWL
ncbi:dicarboxylate transport, partial [Pseudomonas sp. A-1]